ncbi:MAG: non-ribosomal peptide synthetase, partial [Thermoanaerobaculia bacterium]
MAYIIYTSGSTGTPKAAMTEHRGVCNVALAQQSAFGNGPEDRVLQFAASSFDVSIYDFVMALLASGALYVPVGEEALPGPALLRLMREGAMTIATLPPSVLALLPADELPSLRVVVSAGETCPPGLVPIWSAGGRAFFNAYGPTECSIWSAVERCRAEGGRTPLGRPIDNVRAYVLDPSLEPVPAGLAGELFLGGAGVGRGYLGRPGLTAERFLPDPFAGEPGARMYRTGDRVRWLPDGRLDILGRLDDQLKVRGFRVEPGEIEAALRAHPRVRDAAVVLRDGPAHEPRLVAYVVAREGGAPEPSDLRGFLQPRLPAYMVPPSFVTLPALPLNSSGKVDRRALASLPEAAPRPAAPAPPRDALERLVCEVVAETFGREMVGVQEHFFDELAGSSLTVVRAAARLQERLGREVPV